MNRVRVLIPTGFGLNCDRETAYTFALAGADAQRVHINHLIRGAIRLADFHILVLGGGFSWGDDHGAGVIQAVRLKTHLGEQLQDFVGRGNLVLGICNGFQTLVNLGLLPALAGNYRQRAVALVTNDCGNFRDQWVNLKVNPASPCVFTRGMDSLELPIRHGEGKFYADKSIQSQLWRQHQVVLQYADAAGAPAGGAFPANPNGSLDDIAGICDLSGRIFGLMPHPEAWHHFTQHPDWTRRARTEPETLTIVPPGLKLIQNGVRHQQQQLNG